jgi:hypothetical protein
VLAAGWLADKCNLHPAEMFSFLLTAEPPAGRPYTFTPAVRLHVEHNNIGNVTAWRIHTNAESSLDRGLGDVELVKARTAAVEHVYGKNAHTPKNTRAREAWEVVAPHLAAARARGEKPDWRQFANLVNQSPYFRDYPKRWFERGHLRTAVLLEEKRVARLLLRHRARAWAPSAVEPRP